MDPVEAGCVAGWVVKKAVVADNPVLRKGLVVDSLVELAGAVDHHMEAVGVDTAAAVSLSQGTVAGDIGAATWKIQAKPRNPDVP